MLNVATANLLARYKQWADRTFFDGLATLPAEELDRPRAGPIGSMIAVLNHMYVVDRIWQAHLQRRDHGFRSRQEMPWPALAGLRQAQEEIDDWFVSWSAGQTEQSLAEPIEFSYVSGNPGVMSAGAMLLHVVNHMSYHRGWLVQMYFQIPAMPPMTDLSVYLTDTPMEPADRC
ncbi:DinB family protein [compost metagenome]|uniref:Uncharacterized damage-inducible protein DinB (Forms a four-helix bundle) n=2 Tax=Pseudomonas jinjuensis TaxID=198616 RepID=A0A1H0LJE6_9PSED|nr:Uncharacterized damage-inducible protein DinB (forms a four-helix bundle) [Pseudomonas jinjuensis]